jgi:hypothetical protein
MTTLSLHAGPRSDPRDVDAFLRHGHADDPRIRSDRFVELRDAFSPVLLVRFNSRRRALSNSPPGPEAGAGLKAARRNS